MATAFEINLRLQALTLDRMESVLEEAWQALAGKLDAYLAFYAMSYPERFLTLGDREVMLSTMYQLLWRHKHYWAPETTIDRDWTGAARSSKNYRDRKKLDRIVAEYWEGWRRYDQDLKTLNVTRRLAGMDPRGDYYGSDYARDIATCLVRDLHPILHKLAAEVLCLDPASFDCWTFIDEEYLETWQLSTPTSTKRKRYF